MILTGNNSGYDMTYDTETTIFQLIQAGAVLKESKSLDAIDKFINMGCEKAKKKKKFKRVNILISNYHGDMFSGEGQATSIAEPTQYGGSEPSFWIVTEKGERQKKSWVHLDTSENRDIFKKIEVQDNLKESINNEITELRKEFKFLTPEMMEE